MKNRLLITAILAGLSNLALAATWNSEAELGVVITSGNSETQNTNGKIFAERESEKWKSFGSLEALGASNTDSETGVENTTAEKYAAKLQSDYKLNLSDYLFGAASYVDDRFSGFEYQATVSAGYGRNIIKTEKHKLSAETGPGMRYFKLSPTPPRNPSDDEAIWHVSAKYIYNITETSKFTQDISIDAGEDSTISESTSAVSARINGKLAMKASLKVRNNSEVPVDAEETDTESALTLVYSIK